MPLKEDSKLKRAVLGCYLNSISIKEYSKHRFAPLTNSILIELAQFALSHQFFSVLAFNLANVLPAIPLRKISHHSIKLCKTFNAICKYKTMQALLKNHHKVTTQKFRYLILQTHLQ